MFLYNLNIIKNLKFNLFNIILLSYNKIIKIIIIIKIVFINKKFNFIILNYKYLLINLTKLLI